MARGESNPMLNEIMYPISTRFHHVEMNLAIFIIWSQTRVVGVNKHADNHITLGPEASANDRGGVKIHNYKANQKTW